MRQSQNHREDYTTVQSVHIIILRLYTSLGQLHLILSNILYVIIQNICTYIYYFAAQLQLLIVNTTQHPLTTSGILKSSTVRIVGE